MSATFARGAAGWIRRTKGRRKPQQIAERAAEALKRERQTTVTYRKRILTAPSGAKE